MHFNVLTIFPEIFIPFQEHGIIRKAIEHGIIRVSITNIRNFSSDKHRTTDDRPYGGGCGMVMKPEPLAEAIRWARKKTSGTKTILLTPQGRMLDQEIAWDYSRLNGLILICGRYEGVDERICSRYVDDEISIGDFVLTGGELAAMLLMDAVARLVPGALGGKESAEKDSFHDHRLEHAHYTRPRNFEHERVPDVLLSGNHEEIENWRFETSLIRTFLKRQDLLTKRPLTKKEMDVLRRWCRDIEKIIQAQSVPGTDALPGGQ
jgi:tRNA (guanine37-N1)-methyltransferase